jgi:LacI family transcriptional regulator
MATIKDVALLAGVGLGTASRAISGKGAVSASALERVQKAVRSLEFRPSRVARALSSRSLGLVGVYVPTFEGTFFAPALQAIDGELRGSNQHMVAASNFGQGSRREKSLNGMRFLIDRECDGILAIDSYMLDADLVDLRKQVPHLVLVNRIVKGMEVDCFSVDHEAAGRLAARALLDQGHRTVAIMHSLRHGPDVTARVAGFKHELSLLGLAPAGEFIIDGLFTFSNAWHCAGDIVDLATQAGNKLPFSALFCASDVLAMATMSRLQGAGIRVPDDLSILGYDDAELAAYTAPSLSTVRIPSTQVAANACRHLINQCYGASLSVQRSFASEVVLRQSLRPGPFASTPLQAAKRQRAPAKRPLSKQPQPTIQTHLQPHLQTV